ncbi:SRPBCC domain-containing protein [Mesorhizobium sp. M0166]|uniref:SRPBCC family protein n=1 Tax=unclassified Mesorhizobium TaxID=325217 RepID=UPI00333A6A8A
MHGSAVHSMTNGETVMASADVCAPPERIFDALVTREVERWWGSAKTYRMTGWAADLSVGGRWSVTVETAAGSHLPASGEFLEIEEPRRIVQTRRYDWDHPTLGRRETKVAWLLEPIAGGTRVTPQPSMRKGGAGCWAGFRRILVRAAWWRLNPPSNRPSRQL